MLHTKTSLFGRRALAGPFTVPDLSGADEAFESVLDAVLVIDADGWIVCANRANERILGYQRSELIGRPLDMLMSQQVRTAHQERLGRYLDAPVARSMTDRLDLSAVRKDGTLVAVEISLAPLITSAGSFTTAVVRDLTAGRRRAVRDRRIASVVQQDLMPTATDRRLGAVHCASRYKPAGGGETVGGDWTDLFALPGGRVGIVVGDVAGRGIEAAGAMARLRTVVRMLAISGLSPAGVMRRLNDAMHETELRDSLRRATLVHAQFDPTTGMLRYCSAGHPPMLTLPKRRKERAFATAPVAAVGGPALGVVPGLKYSEHTIGLEPHSTLIGFTDGLIAHSGRNVDENLLQLMNAVNALPADTTKSVEKLSDALLELSPSDAAGDDIAVLVMTFDPTSDGSSAHGDGEVGSHSAVQGTPREPSSSRSSGSETPTTPW
jgi:PAS domain S-box-containing protein